MDTAAMDTAEERRPSTSSGTAVDKLRDRREQLLNRQE
jgi:hypothetical protein